MTALSYGSMAYLDSLVATVKKHDCANDYEQALKELSFFVEYLGSKGFDMVQYHKILGKVCSM